MTRKEKEILNKLKLLIIETAKNNNLNKKNKYPRILDPWEIEQIDKEKLKTLPLMEFCEYVDKLARLTINGHSLIPETYLNIACCRIMDTNLSDLIDVYLQYSNKIQSVVTVPYFIYFKSEGAPSLSVWLLESQIYLSLLSVYQNSKKGEIRSNIEKDSNLKPLLKVIDLNKEETQDFLSGKSQIMNLESNLNTASTYEYYNEDFLLAGTKKSSFIKLPEVLPPPSQICINYQVKEEQKKNEEEKIKKYEEQKEYAKLNKCPFENIDLENKFRDFVNKFYPQKAQQIDLSPATEQFCNATVKKAADMRIFSYEERIYQPK